MTGGEGTKKSGGRKRASEHRVRSGGEKGSMEKAIDRERGM